MGNMVRYSLDSMMFTLATQAHRCGCFWQRGEFGEICRQVEFLPDLDISSFMAGSYMSAFPARRRMGIQFVPFKWEIQR